jgi:hypothetical protein
MMTTSTGRDSTEVRCDVDSMSPAPSDTIPDDSPILDALERYGDFIDELFDVQHPDFVFTEQNTSRLAIRSVHRVLVKWADAYAPDRPPNSLIVRLSRTLPSVLADVASHPKRLLQRRRAMQPIHQLRELDSNCVQWLTRQPGITLAEKSGHRRSILAVQRYESVDTLENRVVRDLLERCILLASSYLRQHEKEFRTHEWICMTQEFRKLCIRLLALPHMQEISSLPTLPKPNYVLLHDARYEQVWRSYMDVIRLQRRRQQLWQWRHETFGEMVAICMMSTASRLSIDSVERQAAHRYDLRVRETAVRGRFLDWTALPPVWQISRGLYFYVGPVESAALLKPRLGGFTNQPDGFCIVRWNDRDEFQQLLQVAFPDEDVLRPSPGIAQVTLRLTDLAERPSLDREHRELPVPLRLFEDPGYFDEHHAEWLIP